MHGRVAMLALLDPSRQDIPEYAEYLGAIQREAGPQRSLSARDWLPIDLQIADNFPQAVAAYKQYDVLLVNAIFDGMNLVAKEAPLVNDRDGVLVLSENTGAHEELGDWALTVNPFDVAGQAEAIHGRSRCRRRAAAAARGDPGATSGARHQRLDRSAARGSRPAARAPARGTLPRSGRRAACHVDESGGVRMVDVGAKPVSRRRAVARGDRADVAGDCGSAP